MRREISYLQATMYYFVYFINLLITLITRFFYDFPKISDDFQNDVRWSYECFLTFSEDSRRLPRTVRRCFDLISIYFGSFTIETWQILVSKRDEIDIFAREITGDPCNLIDSQ